jgi:hypothetical protein
VLGPQASGQPRSLPQLRGIQYCDGFGGLPAVGQQLGQQVRCDPLARAQHGERVVGAALVGVQAGQPIPGHVVVQSRGLLT